jgi:Integrase zinc binding domain/Integrase core domain
MVVADALSRDVFPPPSCSHFHEQLKSLVEAPALPTAAEMRNEVSEEQLRLSKDAASESGWSLNEDGIACYRTHAGTRMFVPKRLRKRILSYCHGNLLHGHYGVLRTMDKFPAHFWWPTLRDDCATCIDECHVCAMERVRRPKRHARFGRWQASRRGEVAAVDVHTITPASPEGCTKVLVMADALTGFCWATPMKDETASIVAETLYREWTCRFGPPERLLSDPDSAFPGDVMARLCKKLGIKKKY